MKLGDGFANFSQIGIIFKRIVPHRVLEKEEKREEKRGKTRK
jgi:hypothetical protein